MSKLNNKKITDLYRAILIIKNINEARRFFRDLLTADEIIEFSQRWQVAQMLAKNVPYSVIEKETGLSSTTIARVAKWLNGRGGGYRTIMKKLHHHSSVQSRKGLS
jgi:TrpR-related protein YerC/YecD